MKVGIYLVSDDNPSIGGNFSYYSKFINAIENYTFTKELDVCFVGRMNSNTIKLKKEYVKLTSLTFYKIFEILCARLLPSKLNLCSRLDTALLRKNHIDIVLFPKQFVKEVNDFPFISMNWDAGHKTTFAFPELLEHFEFRENWYQLEIQKAMSIFVESQTSKEEFCNYYQIPPEKIEIIPLFAGGVVDLNVEEAKQSSILNGLGIEKDNYFYYPAQYWAHKNHYVLIHAFKKLIQDNKNLKLVFSGSDKGNKEYIRSIINENGLQDHVLLLGFISNEEVFTLYKNAIALVMPTYLGPTNMPVIEAQGLGTAVICSDLKGHRETCGDGALYVDPKSSENWYVAMKQTQEPDFRKALIDRANAFKSKSLFNIQSSIKALESNLIKLIPIRKSFY